MKSVFISYRRSDSQHVADRLYDHLVARTGPDPIFKDVDDIPAGVDFREVLDTAISRADVVLVLIGPDWLKLADAEGRRRLDDPNDFVRTELQSALESGRIVIPVLVKGASLPTAEELPTPLEALAYRNALPLRPDPDFSNDVVRLCGELDFPEQPLLTVSGGHKTFRQLALRHLPSIRFAVITSLTGAVLTLGLGYRDLDERMALFGLPLMAVLGVSWIVTLVRATPLRPGATTAAWLLSSVTVLATLFLASAFVNPRMRPFLEPEVFVVQGVVVAPLVDQPRCGPRAPTTLEECPTVKNATVILVSEDALAETDDEGFFRMRLPIGVYGLGNLITIRVTHPSFEPRSVTDTLNSAVADLGRIQLRRPGE